MDFANPDITHENKTPESHSERVVPFFFSLPSTSHLATALQNPYSVYMEVGIRHKLESALALITAHAPDFSLSLKTISTYRGNVTLAEIIMAHLRQRFKLSDDKIMPIVTCLHEALVNAVMHGNLSLESSLESWADMESHFGMVSNIVSIEPYASRRIIINAWRNADYLTLSVSDEGKGFRIPAPLSEDQLVTTESAKSHYGRGFHIIQSLTDKVWVGQGRRTLFMRFENN